MRNKNQKGFTLIELLVVIAIIGLLASVVLLALNSARAKARDAKRIADVRQIAAALELYANDCQGYPVLATPGATVVTALGAPGTAGTATAPAGPCAGNPVNLVGAYSGVLPAAPLPFETGCTAAQNTYTYISTSSTYSISFCLGAQTGGTAAGPHTITQTGMQ